MCLFEIADRINSDDDPQYSSRSYQMPSQISPITRSKLYYVRVETKIDLKNFFSLVFIGSRICVCLGDALPFLLPQPLIPNCLDSQLAVTGEAWKGACYSNCSFTDAHIMIISQHALHRSIPQTALEKKTKSGVLGKDIQFQLEMSDNR